MTPIEAFTIFLLIIGAVEGNDKPHGPDWNACERIDNGGYNTFADPKCAK